ncbi:uncharacterized protein LOC117407014 isoform X1 [Acipenser ruthenus]|uniref:uncharacterized protein LOC117407014 isoform X1 n=1 Tax=Acipenser ruthenus TaxID=7906 RepID=UPI00145A69A9|nr:uncharacterized protein LOC117407014 isoform X1 [Acipenser ruthenus]XP_058890905.1 uncharacterized protein LOC117407014 isoform X1 [Acipenser ruthenus]XP_058890906.1 uncharacterized protein LOC117407014 isoform X1 [Acipenser ruthenus]
MEPHRKKTCKRKHIEITVDDSDNDDTAVNGVLKNKKVSIDPSHNVSNSVVNSIFVPKNTLNSDPSTSSHTHSMSTAPNVCLPPVHPQNLNGFENFDYLDKLLNDINYNAYSLPSIRALIDEISPDRPPINDNSTNIDSNNSQCRVFVNDAKLTQINFDSLDKLLHEMYRENHDTLESVVDVEKQIGGGLNDGAYRDDSFSIKVLGGGVLHDDQVAGPSGLQAPHRDSAGDRIGGEGVQRIHRPMFNNFELKQPLNFTHLYDLDSYAEVFTVLHETLENMLSEVSRTLRPSDVVQLELRAGSLDIPVYVKMSGANLSLDDFLSQIEALLQSHSEILADDSLMLIVQVIRCPEGGGVRRCLQTLMKSELIRKKAKHLIICYNRDNQLCFAYSVLSLIFPEFRGAYEMCMAEALKLQQSVGLSEHQMVSFVDIDKFEQALDVKIVVWYRCPQKDVFLNHQTDTRAKNKTVFLFLHENHFYGIVNLKGFLGAAYLCNYCYTAYSNRSGHRCEGHCNVCFSPACNSESSVKVKCNDCNRYCRSQLCYDEHKILRDKANSEKQVSMCDLLKLCTRCYSLYKCDPTKPQTHKCLTPYCKLCKAVLLPHSDHKCFIQMLKPKEPTDKYVFYDFECRQEAGVHIPNYLYCMHMGGESWYWEGEECVKKFFERYRRPCYAGYTFLAHNAKSYDSYLLMNYLVSNGINPNIIAQGSKLMCFTDEAFKMRYIDSFNFLPMKLSALPAAMGFEAKKGYFPHFFNTVENQNYVGPFPEPIYYGVQQMMSKDRDDFYKWYDSIKMGVFNFRDEMAFYCKNDVEILKEACIKFRTEVYAIGQIDPFQCTTIASLCMAMYRSKFMPKDTIAIIPPDNYSEQQKSFSNASIQWLMYVAETENVFIQHALNYGELKIGPFFLDGYAVINGKRTAFEFAGCFFHGCPLCYDSADVNPLSKVSCGTMHHHFDEKIETLQKVYGVEVRVIWEHEWNTLKKQPKVHEFLIRSDFPERINPREALFGGRTNAITLHYVAQENERVEYFDFTSLYPFVNKTKVYPVDHPTVIYHNFQDLSQYFGLFKLTVLPPRGLYFPVLPARICGKLMFTLCRSCAETLNQTGVCNHTSGERALTGTWCSVEVVKALEKGYKVSKIHEVWHFPQKSDTLFTGYINSHLKGKQESSGYPAHCTDEERKERYIAEYFQKEGVQLDPQNINVNPAKRQISKLCLNSLWGKLAQRTNQLSTSLVKDPDQFFHYLFSKRYQVSHFCFVSDTVAQVQWRYASDTYTPTGNVNVFIAAFTTAYARLELYNLLDRLQGRCLYHDTDSVIFVSRPQAWRPKLGDYLGDLTSELKPGEHITEFVSGGPKTYGYVTNNGKTCLKVKGITLNYENSKLINIASLKDLVQNFVNHDRNTPAEHIMIRGSQICRNKKEFQLENKPLQKTFQIVYNKRVLRSDFTSIPYGY